MFIVVQKIRISPNPFLTKVAALTFGIYLCHFVLVQCSYDLLIGIPLAVYVKIPLIACVAFAISLALVWVLSLTRLTRKSIM